MSIWLALLIAAGLIFYVGGVLWAGWKPYRWQQGRPYDDQNDRSD